MHAKKLLAVLLLAAAAASATPALAQGGLTTTNFTFKRGAFNESVDRALNGNVIGYQFVLIKDGRLVTEGANGWARTSADGLLKMTTRTPINVGSLFKFMTGTALLHVMEHPAKWTANQNYDLRTQLDTHIWGHFPAVWYNNMAYDVRKISYRQLLQHRSGFDDDFKGPRTEMGFLKAGFTPAQFDKREYSNINFVMTGHLLSVYENTHLLADVNGVVQNENMSTAGADTYVQNRFGRRMLDIFRERIWSKMSPRFSPSCNATVDFKDTAAYGYHSKTDKGKGLITSSIERRGHCGGEGGFYMSTRDYANYVAHFAETELIVSDKARDMMYKEGMNPDDRLIWAGATDRNWRSYDWFQKNFKSGTLVWSAGGTEGTNAVLLRLPENYYLVLAVNSNDFKVNELFNVGTDAFIAATKDNFK